MTYQTATISDDLNSLPKLPGWVTSGRAETPEDVASLSGAALNHLHLVVHREDVPQSLLRERLALCAAEGCMVRSERIERAGELRDAVGFLQPGDQPGPAGEVYLSWRRAKGAGEAVQLFLSRDAVAPAALTSLNSDRAARRFCDRLFELGVVRELTGRDTFRLYGL